MADWPYNTTRWQCLREAKLAADPLCYACRLRGKMTPACAVDHITPVKAGGDPFPPLDGLMSLCERCHNEKTGALDHPERASIGRRFKGFDAEGNPIDPADDWHSGGAFKDGKRLSSGPMPQIKLYLVSGDLVSPDDDVGFA